MSMIEAGSKTYTPEDLLAMPEGDRFELVDGHLVELNMSALSSLVAATLGHRIGNYCEGRIPAWIFGADCGIRCFPGHPLTVRKPRVSLVLRERLPVERLAEDFLTLSPDLIIEAIAPNDLAAKVEEKVQGYLQAGVRLVWIVYPSTRMVQIRRGDGSIAIVPTKGELDGEDVLPGFRRRVADIFPALPPAAPGA